LPGLDLLVILRGDFDDIAADLRRDHRRLPAHIGIIGGLQSVGKRHKAPGPQCHGHASHRQSHKQQRHPPAVGGRCPTTLLLGRGFGPMAGKRRRWRRGALDRIVQAFVPGLHDG
jgi:hypothetical protein